MCMASKQQEEFAKWILEQVGSSNPYGRAFANKKSEYYIYQSGFLASYLASLMQEDPFIAQRFKKHIAEKKYRK